ncbi:MAG: hypothetical protein V3W19_16285 [Desulfatiglandales bacterium]
MNAKNKELSTAQFKNVPTKRAQIVIRFDVPEEEATPEYMSAMAAVIKINLLKPLGKSAEVTGKWL